MGLNCLFSFLVTRCGARFGFLKPGKQSIDQLLLLGLHGNASFAVENLIGLLLALNPDDFNPLITVDSVGICQRQSLRPQIRIEISMTTTTALIIIDMQHGIQQWGGRQRNNPQAADQILRLLTTWRNAAAPVVHVRHISREAGAVFAPGQAGCVFHAPLLPLSHEAVFEKNVTDAFLHTSLERWLRVRGIQRLAITGVATENSVESSARTAGNLGFDTYVVEDACFTYEKRDHAGRLRTAEEVHDMALGNLAQEFAQIIDTKTLIDSMT
jgi:nicotinamidase-related amidase